MSKIADIIERLNSGEKIKCLSCKAGYYDVENRPNNYFRCSKCGSLIGYDKGLNLDNIDFDKKD